MPYQIGEPVDHDNRLPIETPFLSEARGLHPGLLSVHKFGYNAAVAASTTEDIWDGGDSYPGFLTAASAVRIAAGGNAADTSDGAGARKVMISGLDENWATAQEEVVTAGASQSSATTTTFIRVNRAWVTDSGAYGAANTAAITIETTGAVTVAVVSAEFGQTQMAIYTVPIGWQGFLRRIDGYVEGLKPADIDLWQRQDADVIAAPFTAKRLVRNFPQLTGFAEATFTSYPGPFPAKTDLWASASAASGASPPVNCDFDLILVAT